MADETAPEVPEDFPENVNSCSSCQGPVRVRRKSATGYHFCAKRACQNEKQRTYYRLRNSESGRLADLDELAALAALLRAASGEWTSCDWCRAAHVLPGWAHVGADGKACTQLGARGPELGPRAAAIIGALMPYVPAAEIQPPAPTPQEPEVQWATAPVQAVVGGPTPLAPESLEDGPDREIVRPEVD